MASSGNHVRWFWTQKRSDVFDSRHNFGGRVIFVHPKVIRAWKADNGERIVDAAYLLIAKKVTYFSTNSLEDVLGGNFCRNLSKSNKRCLYVLSVDGAHEYRRRESKESGFCFC